MARPRSLDEIKQREVCALVTAGCSLQTAARYVGCNVVTIRREARRNLVFYDQLRQAEISCQVNPLHAMRRASETHWRAAAWLLERTDPERFGRRHPTHVTAADFAECGRQLTEVVLANVKDPDTLAELDRAINGKLRELQRQVDAGRVPRSDPRARRGEPRPRLPPPGDPSFDSRPVENESNRT